MSDGGILQDLTESFLASPAQTPDTMAVMTLSATKKPKRLVKKL